MKTTILFMIFFQFMIFAAPEKQNLDTLMAKITDSDGITRNNLIKQLYDFPVKKVIKKIKAMLRSDDTDTKEAAAEISGIIKDKSYEPLIKKEIKTAKDFRLVNSLIFSIGSNKYKKLGKYLCKYIEDPKHQKTAYLALIKLNNNSCFKEFSKTLRKKDEKKKISILEYIIKTKNKKYLKQIKKLFKKSKNSQVKHSCAIALLVLNDKSSLNYLKNYLNKDLSSEDLQLSAYKSFDELLNNKNKNTETIFLNGIRNSNSDKVKLFCIKTMVKKKLYDKLSQKDIDFIESFSNSNDIDKYVMYSEYKRFLKINYPQKEEDKKNINETISPQ